jgi:hypothetical protein
MAFNLNFDVGAAKDKSLSKLLLASARQYLHEYGEVLDLVLNTTARSISVEVLPVGESAPIRVDLSGYGLMTDSTGRGWLTFEQLSTSRQWLTLVAERAMPEKRLPLPSSTPMGLLNTIL